MSKTYIGIIVVIAGWLGIGDILTNDVASSLINNILELVGIVMAIYGRYKAGGINFFGIKK